MFVCRWTVKQIIKQNKHGVERSLGETAVKMAGTFKSTIKNWKAWKSEKIKMSSHVSFIALLGRGSLWVCNNEKVSHSWVAITCPGQVESVLNKCFLNKFNCQAERSLIGLIWATALYSHSSIKEWSLEGTLSSSRSNLLCLQQIQLQPAEVKELAPKPTKCFWWSQD